MARRLKMLAVSAVVAASAVLLAPSASEAAGRRAGGGDRLQTAVAQLDLTPAQRTQVNKIIAEAKSEKASTGSATTWTGSTTSTGKCHRGSGKKSTVEKVMSVLNTDQQTKLKGLLQVKRAAKA